MPSVLHVVSYFPPDRIGGVGEVVSHVHRALCAAGHISRVVTTGPTHGDPSVVRVGLSPALFPLTSARALRLAREADLVHIHHGEGVGLLVAMRLARIATPVLLTLHVGVRRMADASGSYRIGSLRFAEPTLGDWLHQRIAMPFRALLDRIARALATDISFIARSAAHDNWGADGAAARVIYNGVSLDAAAATAAPVDLLFVGSDTPRKRGELLPLILHAVRQRVPAARLRIVGFDGTANPAILALAEELGVAEALEFAGPLPASEVAAQYRAARVLVVPSAYEGLPMVVLEAFAQGLPCVATAVSGHPEVVRDGWNGYLVPVDDVDALATRAAKLLLDDACRREMAQRARATVVERFSVARQVEEYLAWYAQHAGAH